MAKQTGREMLLAIWDGVSAYRVIAGITAKTIGIGNNLIDVSTPDATTPANIVDTELMAGNRSFSISGDITFEDDAAFADLEAVAIANPPSENFRVTIPSLATYTGSFFVESLDLTGATEGAVTGSVSLKSSGLITRAAI